MNTDQLECFVSLSNTLNYVKTAEQLGLSQPAVSKQIQSLERELGTTLFHRTTRSVTLTEIGAQFLPEANAMLKTYYHSREWIADFRKASLHTLRIGYSDPHSIYRISLVLKELLALNQNLMPELVYDQTDANLRRLANGQLDLLISMRDARFSDEQIVFKKIQDEQFYCVFSREHPLAECLPVDLFPEYEIDSQTVWPYRQIISIPPYLLKNHFSRGRRIVPVNDSLNNMVCTNTSEAYGLLLTGIGYSFVPGHLLMQHPDLLFCRWKESPKAPFGVYYRKNADADKSSEIHAFMETAQSVYFREQ